MNQILPYHEHDVSDPREWILLDNEQDRIGIIPELTHEEIRTVLEAKDEQYPEQAPHFARTNNGLPHVLATMVELPGSMQPDEETVVDIEALLEELDADRDLELQEGAA